MTPTAFVIPADPAEPCRTVDWLSPSDLLPLLRREIGCDWVERVSVEIDGAGRVMVWVDENGRYAAPRTVNHRFLGFATKLGQPHLIFGTVVLTGDDNLDGDSLGLPAELLADLPTAVEVGHPTRPRPAATSTRTRSQQEIVERITAVTEEDFFGFRREILGLALDFEHARTAGLLQADTTAEQWAEIGAGGHDEQLRVDAAEYLVFAFDKARNHRGISAERSVHKLAEYAWLLGRDGLAVEMHQDVAYPMYGVPALLLFARAFDLPVPDGDDLVRMGRGEPCRPGCEEGCGR